MRWGARRWCQCRRRCCRPPLPSRRRERRTPCQVWRDRHEVWLLGSLPAAVKPAVAALMGLVRLGKLRRARCCLSPRCRARPAACCSDSQPGARQRRRAGALPAAALPAHQHTGCADPVQAAGKQKEGGASQSTPCLAVPMPLALLPPLLLLRPALDPQFEVEGRVCSSKP